MIGIGIFGVALLLLIGEIAGRCMRPVEPIEFEVDIRWIRRPEGYQKIEADWDRIMEGTLISAEAGEHA